MTGVARKRKGGRRSVCTAEAVHKRQHYNNYCYSRKPNGIYHNGYVPTNRRNGDNRQNVFHFKHRCLNCVWTLAHWMSWLQPTRPLCKCSVFSNNCDYSKSWAKVSKHRLMFKVYMFSKATSKRTCKHIVLRSTCSQRQLANEHANTYAFHNYTGNNIRKVQKRDVSPAIGRCLTNTCTTMDEWSNKFKQTFPNPNQPKGLPTRHHRQERITSNIQPALLPLALNSLANSRTALHGSNTSEGMDIPDRSKAALEGI